ncbi:hypothetical protein [Aneurinibacillus sp. REN35]|uniref:hypothetical protein n=1 Tax=Aneurinibacillus sp. REN35 TaxID=3237286 RepID=UPI003526E264
MRHPCPVPHRFIVPLLLVCLLLLTPQQSLATSDATASAPDISSRPFLSLREMAPFFAEAEKKGITRMETSVFLYDAVHLLEGIDKPGAISAFERKQARILDKLFGRKEIAGELQAFAEDAVRLTKEKLVAAALSGQPLPVEKALQEALTETAGKPQHKQLIADLKQSGITPAALTTLLKQWEAVLDPEHTWRARLQQAVERLVQEALKTSAANAIVKASSDRASDVYVTFARPFNFETFRSAWLDKDVVLQVTMRGVSVPVRHIAQENPRVLRIGFSQEQPLEETALISVALHDLRKKPTFADSASSFVLTDKKLPALLNTRQTESGALELEFDEPIYTGIRNSGYELWKLNGHEVHGQLNGKKPQTADSRLSGDFRRFAVLELSHWMRPHYQPPGKKNVLQGSGIADYSGHRSGKRLHNVVIDFVSPPAIEPIPTVSAQSPEQFMLRFPSKTVSMYGHDPLLGPEDIRLERQSGWDEAGNPRWTTAGIRPYEDWALEYDGNAAYYLQLRRDWSHILQTEEGNPSYSTAGYNRVRITLLKGRAKDAGSGTVNQSDHTYEIVLPADALPPKIQTVTPSYASVPGQETLNVTFNEPVQISNATRHLTPARETGAVPKPVFELVSLQSKARIALSPIGYLTTKDDKTYIFPIPQEAAKEAGKWQLAVQNLSDDVGNTASALTHPVNIRSLRLLPHKPLETPALVFGAAVDHTIAKEAPEAEDVVVLQFNTILSADARKTGNYFIAGQPLSSKAKVLLRSTRFDSTNDGSISDEDRVGTRVTFLLPKDTFSTQNSAAESVQGVSFNVQVKTETGEAINKWGKLPYVRSGTPDTIIDEVAARYARKEASLADRMWLATAIRQAESELSAARAGGAAGEFPSEAIQAFRQATAEAKRTAVKIPAMRGAIETAIHSLQTAQNQFYASQHRPPADKWNLIMQLRIAQAEWADIKANPYKYPYTLSEAFAAAIAQAEAVVAKENATEEEIYAAYRALVDVVNEKTKYDTIPGYP